MEVTLPNFRYKREKNNVDLVECYVRHESATRAALHTRLREIDFSRTCIEANFLTLFAH